MKKLIPVLLAAALLCVVCCSIAEERTQPEILAVFSSPETQIITNDDQTKELADTVIFLYRDYSYIQYVDHENRYEIYTKGTFDVNFDWTEPGWQEKKPHILTIHAEQIHTAGHQTEAADLTYDVNLDRAAACCLYPDNDRTDLELVAAFMQVDKQKLVKADGSEQFLLKTMLLTAEFQFVDESVSKESRKINLQGQTCNNGKRQSKMTENEPMPEQRNVISVSGRKNCRTRFRNMARSAARSTINHLGT